MFRPVPALLALTVTGALLPALEISDNDTKFSFGLYLQGVAAKASAANKAGDSYNAIEGIDGHGDDADFYLRRLRTVFRGAHKGFIFQATLSADDYGRVPTSTAPSVGLYDAFVGKEFKMDGGISHRIAFGKQTTWFNTVVTRSGAQQFATGRASAAFMNVNGVGVGYRFAAPVISLGIDVQNNTGDESTDQVVATTVTTTNATNNSTGSNNIGEGLTYTARLELTGPSADSWAIGKWQESFAGVAGKGVALGLEAGAVQRDRVNTGKPANAAPAAPGTQAASKKTMVMGADVLLHIDGLTALAAYHHQAVEVNADADNKDDSTGSEVMAIQAGYAFPVDGLGVLEPALRYQKIDFDTANDSEGTSFGNKDFGNSGNEIDFGLNLYLSGHSNKLNLVYTKWTGEDTGKTGESAPTANIVRLQHQLLF